MELTGKCKELFEKWAIKNNILKRCFYLVCLEVENSLVDFYKIPFSMQCGVYVDFFDSVGLRITVEPYNPSTKVKQIDGIIYEFAIYPDGEDGLGYREFKTRQEARESAIQKANDLINNR